MTMQVSWRMWCPCSRDGKSALDLVRHYKPDLVVLHIQMPGLNGLEVTTQLADDPESPPVVICSVETGPDVVNAALQAGAFAYVFKMRIYKDLILATKSVLQRKAFVSLASR